MRPSIVFLIKLPCAACILPMNVPTVALPNPLSYKLGANGGWMRGSTVRWTRRHGHLTMDSPSHPREGEWTCPERADTPDVGVSPRGGSPNGEAGGGERGTPTAAPGVHAGVQGRGHCLGAPGRAVAAGDLSRARPE